MLPDNQSIRIWALRSPKTINDNLANSVRDMLDTDEIDQISRFATPQLQAAFAYRRVARRMIAAASLGLSVSQVRFQTDRCGAPVLARSGVQFSSSSSGRRVLIGVARGGRFGLDVQQPVEGLEHSNLLGKIACQHEIDAGRCTWGGGLSRTFYRLWVAKEAAVKALGIGLAMDLKQVDVSATSNGASIIVRSSTFEVRLSAVYIGIWRNAEACVAFEGDAPDIQVYHELPGQLLR